MSLSQRARTLAITTPLGEDVLLLRGMHATERLSTLFAYQLDLISTDITLRHEALLGQPATVRLTLPDGGARYFNGLFSRFAHTGFDGALAIYRATLVPWTWFLTRTADCRIFQEQTVPDILKEIFREHGYADFEEALSGPHHRRTYCVQYRETDFDFISRLMEQEGIYYYFRHENGKHTLVLADHYGAHHATAGYAEIPYYPPSATALRERDHIYEWSVAGAVQPGAFTHTDFDFTAPRKQLLTTRLHPHEHARADLEIYDYPGGYTQHDKGDDWVRTRIEELHVDYETAQGAGNARGLTTGALFTLTGYRREDQNREYLVVAADYQLQSDAFGSTAQASTGPVFQCTFTALEAQTPYRPPRNTPTPQVKGPQTAVVVGKAGEEIWTDQYGRVKVQFHWDRYGKADEQSSCWVRVSQPWAGKGWGAMAIPRIGQEVIVEFLEGDPDQPIITGRVYNDANQPPYGLPAGAAVSGLKSESTKGGGGYNEYVMDDTKGNELIREHGQYDKDSTIEHDLREHVLNDRSRDVTNNETIQVGNDRAKTVDKNETTTIGVDRTETVGANETITIGDNRTETVGTNETLSIGANRTEQVGGSETVTIGAAKAETIAAAKALSIGAAYQVSVGGAMNTSVGLIQAEEVGLSKNVLVGKKFFIKAGDELEIVVGDSSLVMKQDGTIKLQGKLIHTSGGDGVKIDGKVVDIN
ncbi:MAG: type VI secretion system tip protein VgrG [Candidatus Thiosymbion ectosymbiont of Robbea hypermnestra]|nr:type VI secretion system tip protein VgrG [Candidatus Thiosymbion ectosymbiont of Robbea hypermnestra]